MRSSAMISLVLSLLVAGVAPLPAQDSPVAFVGVSVVPMTREGVVPNQTVVVANGRIVAIGPTATTAVPAGAMRVEGGGKFLMPGLAEMHAHVPPGQGYSEAAMERVLALYALHGVTTIRGMLGDPRHLPWRDRLARGEVLGPWLWTSGPSHNGTTVPTVEAAIQLVTEQKAAGYDLLKIHPGVQREVFESLATTAHRLDIPFAGHVPVEVGVERAIELGYSTIDHIDGYVEALVADGAPLTGSQTQWFGLNLTPHLDLGKLPALVRKTQEAGIWQVPTQSLFETTAGAMSADELAARPEMVYASAREVAAWKTRTDVTRRMVDDATRARFLQARRTILKQMIDAGVPFLLGSDAPQIWNIPGYSVRRELDALVAAGFTPWQALASGTTNVARFLGVEALAGTVETGKRADLILLDGNPLTDIANVGRQAGVMVKGAWYPATEVERRLAALRLQ